MVLHALTIVQIEAQSRQGTFSPVALTESCLARIEAVDPILKAWVTVNSDSALRQAKRAEVELEHRGPRSPLHGVPVGLKDIFYTKEMRTTANAKVFQDFVPPFDATVVSRLKRAGAIILGKTVTVEFAASTDPPPTVNPWNAAHTPGGTSSGSAVAVAARMCPLALGSQTIGSTNRPAAYNGIVGLKPTYGRISKYGMIPFSWSLDHVGIMVRTVEDAALTLKELSGYDRKDPTSSRRRVSDFRKAIDTLKNPPRIGVIREFFLELADEETRSHTEHLLTRFGQSGATIKEIRLPKIFSVSMATQDLISEAEGAAYQEEMFQSHGADYAPDHRRRIEGTAFIPAIQYIQAQRLRRQFRREMESLIRRVDVLLVPTTPTPAPRDLTSTGDSSFLASWTFIGFPSITIPTGLSRLSLPLGTQLIAQPFAEERLLAVASWCENILGIQLTPPEPVDASAP